MTAPVLTPLCAQRSSKQGGVVRADKVGLLECIKIEKGEMTKSEHKYIQSYMRCLLVIYTITVSSNNVKVLNHSGQFSGLITHQTW